MKKVSKCYSGGTFYGTVSDSISLLLSSDIQHKVNCGIPEDHYHPTPHSESCHEKSHLPLPINRHAGLLIATHPHRNSGWSRCRPCRAAAACSRLARPSPGSWRRGRCSCPPTGWGCRRCGTRRGSAARAGTTGGGAARWWGCRLSGCLRDTERALREEWYGSGTWVCTLAAEPSIEALWSGQLKQAKNELRSCGMTLERLRN